MINIAIIDDEKEMRDQAGDIVESCIADKETLRDIMEENDLPELNVHLYKFSNAREFLMRSETVRFHIAFSDISMPGIDGIELGKCFREKWPMSCFIYLTSYSEYAPMGYRMNVFQYILKDDMKERLPSVLWDAIRNMAKLQIHRIAIGTATGQRYINSSDIFYIRKEKNTKYVEYVTQTGVFRDRKTLDQAVAQMQQYEFIKVERGFAVNIRHVIQLKGSVIKMRDKEEITVSRLYIAAVRQKLSEYGRKL